MPAPSPEHGFFPSIREAQVHCLAQSPVVPSEPVGNCHSGDHSSRSSSSNPERRPCVGNRLCTGTHTVSLEERSGMYFAATCLTRDPLCKPGRTKQAGPAGRGGLQCAVCGVREGPLRPLLFRTEVAGF